MDLAPAARRLNARSWMMRAVPGRATSSTPKTAASSSATPIGRVPWAPRKDTSAGCPFCRMKISNNSSTNVATMRATHTPPIRLRGDLMAQLDADFEMYHLDADLKWIDGAEARLDRLAAYIKEAP